MPAATADPIVQLAAELITGGDPKAAADSLIAAAGADRERLETARAEVASRLHLAPDDWEATAILTLLNRSLARLPRVDPLDWRMRWAKHRKP